ncbi:transposase family protein, partial [Oscillatoria sp. HE19RPO]|uniref:transposase family protein n=1 Tax=Oscillatoria sp. HE19RPO TaxID=2954806 RepID=UPI0020C1ECBD
MTRVNPFNYRLLTYSASPLTPEQKEHFSGKKKTHTLKNQLIVLPKGEDIVDIKIGEKGPVSDIKIFK